MFITTVELVVCFISLCLERFTMQYSYNFPEAFLSNINVNIFQTQNAFPPLACAASVPMQVKSYVSRVSEDSGRAKIGARAKKEKEAAT